MHTFSHSLWTSTSASCLQLIKLSIQPSKVGIEAVSVEGDSLEGSGTLPTSSMLVSMLFLLVLSSVMLLLWDGGELELNDDNWRATRSQLKGVKVWYRYYRAIHPKILRVPQRIAAKGFGYHKTWIRRGRVE
jgi:hypothetical protein